MESDSDLHPATVNRELVARLTFNNPTLAKSITSLESTLHLFADQFGASTRDFQTEGEHLHDDRLVVQFKLPITRYLLGIRLGAHLTEVVESLSNQRTLSVAQSVRAVLETAGAAVYYEDKFRACAEDFQALLAQVDRSLYGKRFEWEEWHAAIGKKSRGELETFLCTQSQRGRNSRIDHDSPPSVMTFIDALEKSHLRKLTEPAKREGKPTPMAGHVRAIYSQLCDFVHPSVGSWKTYARTEPEAFKVVISSSSRLESLQFLWFGIGQCVATMALLGFHALEDMEKLRTSLVRSIGDSAAELLIRADTASRLRPLGWADESPSPDPVYTLGNMKHRATPNTPGSHRHKSGVPLNSPPRYTAESQTG